MVVVYALRSVSRNYIYVGMSAEIEVRVQRHNEGKNRTTKAYAPFKLIYTKAFENRVDARVYEKYLKTGVGRGFLKKL